MTKSCIKLLTLIVLTVILGCNSQPDESKAATLQPGTICKPYFTYDQVEHYSFDISDDAVWSIGEKENKTDKEIKQWEILIHHKPDTITDTSIVKNIDKIGFVKKELGKSNFDAFNKIFCERKHEESIVKFCAAIYRDVLVFKKDNQIVGTAKICFGCDHHIIAGTARNTKDFGQSGDYEVLYNLLHSIKPQL